MPRNTDMCSLSGVDLCCEGTVVSWLSRMQECVTLSTTEDEYMAIADRMKEVLYVRGALVFLMPE